MDDRRIKLIIKAIERLLGNPLESDSDEVSALYAEFFPDENPATSLYDLAGKVAQRYRLDGKSVPSHVAEVLASTKKALSGGSEDADAGGIIDEALRPMLGPSAEVSCAFHNRTTHSDNDRTLLEKLSEEVKQDWNEDKKK